MPLLFRSINPTPFVFRFIHPRLLAFDIEWIPDPHAAGMLYGIDTSSHHGVEDAFRKLWAEGGATESNPHPFIKLTLSRIVSICGIYREVDDSGTVHHKLVTIPSRADDPRATAEPNILKAFLRSTADKRPQLVGFNSARSDLPIILNRSIVHGLSSYGWAMRPEKPWEGVDYFGAHSDYHLDLAAFLGWGAQTPSLHEIATISGIPGKIDMCGSSVAEMVLSGQLDKVIAYNEYDAFTTFLLWARVAHFTGHLSDQAYIHEQEAILALLNQEIEDHGKDHLVRYRDTWLDMRAKVDSDPLSKTPEEEST